jgi:HEAT repeat protein
MSPFELSSAARIGLLVGLGFLPVLGGRAKAQEAPEDGDAVEASLASDDDRAERARLLAALGPDPLPVLFDALAGRPGPLDAWTDAELHAALARWPRTEVRSFLSTLAREETDVVVRRVALQVLGGLGQDADLDLLSAVAAWPADAKVVDRSLQRSFGSALERVLARHPDAVAGVVRSFKGTHASLLQPTVQAVGRVGSRAACDALGRLLGRVPAADPLVLVEIERLARNLRAPFDRRLRRDVRDLLGHGEPRTATLAARAAAALRDEEAIPALVGQLATPHDGLRRTVRTSLVTIAGRDVGSDPAAWSSWYESELAWWRSESAHHFLLLNSGDPAKTAAAIKTISARRLRRDELATALLTVLRRGEPQLVRMAVAALGTLAVDATVPELIECLEHRDHRVRTTTLNTLRRMTGWKLPPEADAWRQALDDRWG